MTTQKMIARSNEVALTKIRSGRMEMCLFDAELYAEDTNTALVVISFVFMAWGKFLVQDNNV